MDFGLSEEQEWLRQGAREFLARECPPARLREAFESPEGTSDVLGSRMAAMGWNGILVPESFGGLGLGTLDATILLIELGKAAVPGPFLFSAVLATALLARAASLRQKKEWLPRLASGERSATVGWLEQSDRLDPAGIHARARRRGRRWILTGRKLFVPYASSADVMILPFRTGTRPEEITFFLVRAATPGVVLRPLETIDRTRRLFEVELRQVEVSAGDVLGRVGSGWPLFERLLDLGAVTIAADCLGGAEKTLELAVEYSRTREQFGRPIGSFQAIKHLIAEMVAEIEPARSLVWYAAHALDAMPRQASRSASMAKARLSEVYSRAANRAIQIHGGIGFTWEHDLHFWFKRAKWNELAFGDPTLHRERIARLGAY